MAMKVTIGTKSSSPSTGMNKTATAAKKAVIAKVKMGNRPKAEPQRTLAPSTTMTPTPVAASSSTDMATFAKSSKSNLTKRITQPSFVCTGGTDVPGDLTEQNPLWPRTSMDDSSDNSPAAAFRSVWYLGGNQLAQLLASVDGDLDPIILAKIAEVPSVVGDLALSVESLVSDDVSTIGGFETDLLAQIASNTLASKQHHQQQQTIAALLPLTPPLAPSSPRHASTTVSTTTSTILSPSSSSAYQAETREERSSLTAPTTPGSEATSFLVPNPLAFYDPVPNPLARITPPASPLPTTVSATASPTSRASPTSSTDAASR